MKKAVFLGTLCSDEVFDEIMEKTTKHKPHIAGQRHERMLVEGLYKAGLNIDAISFLPTAPRPHYHQVFSKYKKETVKDIEIEYIPDINIKFIKQVLRSIFALFFLFRWLFINRKSDKYVILGSVYPPVALSVLILKVIFKFKTVAYIPDVSEYRYEYSLRYYSLIGKVAVTCFKQLSLFFDNKFDAYIFITKDMSNLINTRNKPYIVTECMIENDLNQLINSIENKSSPPVIMYAGGISVKYGIGLLIDSVNFISDIPFELWIFGSGSDVDLVIKAAERDHRIKYFGIVKHSVLMRYEMQATLMINPRQSDQGFTKYSFPSKTIEYMASGTPIISTRLKCIPEEYSQYIIYIDEETPEGIGRIITDSLKMGRSFLHNKGLEAREFAFNNKTYIAQTQKIYDFINCELSYSETKKNRSCV